LRAQSSVWISIVLETYRPRFIVSGNLVQLCLGVWTTSTRRRVLRAEAPGVLEADDSSVGEYTYEFDYEDDQVVGSWATASVVPDYGNE
jgi:hypothetical protein